MGIQGVPHNIQKKDLKEAIKKRKGVAAKVQDDLKISHGLFYKLIEQFSLKELLNEERNAYSERMCDIAEDVLVKGMLQTEDMGSALGAAKYVLNNKGRNRGYYPPFIPTESKDGILDEVRAGIKQLSQESRGSPSEQPVVETK